jgi:VRR-NUC domain
VSHQRCNCATSTYRADHSSGFPDLVLVRDRVIFAELKREGGKLSAAQREWVEALEKAGAETYVWFPSMLDQVAEILSNRSQGAPRPPPRFGPNFLPNFLPRWHHRG